MSERAGDHLSFVTEFKLGKSYRDLGFFSGDRRDQFDLMSGSLLMVLITSVGGVGQHLFGCKPHFFSSLDGGDQSLGVMMVRGFNINMSDQSKCRGLIPGAVGFSHLNLVALSHVAIIGSIRFGRVLQGVRVNFQVGLDGVFFSIILFIADDVLIFEQA